MSRWAWSRHFSVGEFLDVSSNFVWATQAWSMVAANKSACQPLYKPRYSPIVENPSNLFQVEIRCFLLERVMLEGWLKWIKQWIYEQAHSIIISLDIQVSKSLSRAAKLMFGLGLPSLYPSCCEATSEGCCEAKNELDREEGQAQMVEQEASRICDDKLWRMPCCCFSCLCIFSLIFGYF